MWLALHLKDVDAQARDATVTAGSDYGTATFGHRVWTEPVRGSIDFDAVLAALPGRFAWWAVTEVDVEDLPDRVESARASYRWAASGPQLDVRT